MKNSLFIAALIMALPVLVLEGCGNSTAVIGMDDTPLHAIVEQLYDHVDVPPCEIIPLDQENFEAYSFIPYDDSLSAVAADALVRIAPHSTVVIRAESGNGPELAYKIIRNADPNKWISVGAETVYAAYTDHYVILVMSYRDTADAILENFKNMAAELDGMEMAFLTAHNPRYEWGNGEEDPDEDLDSGFALTPSV